MLPLTVAVPDWGRSAATLVQENIHNFLECAHVYTQECQSGKSATQIWHCKCLQEYKAHTHCENTTYFTHSGQKVRQTRTLPRTWCPINLPRRVEEFKRRLWSVSLMQRECSGLNVPTSSPNSHTNTTLADSQMSFINPPPLPPSCRQLHKHDSDVWAVFLDVLLSMSHVTCMLMSM